MIIRRKRSSRIPPLSADSPTKSTDVVDQPTLIVTSPTRWSIFVRTRRIRAACRQLVGIFMGRRLCAFPNPNWLAQASRSVSPHRYLHTILISAPLRNLIPRIRVPKDAHHRVVRQHALDAFIGFLGAVADD